MLKKVLALGLVGLMTSMLGITASSQPTTDIFEVNRLLARTMNLSALEAPTEGAWGPKLEERYFDLVKQKGFTAIRLPAKFSGYASIRPPFKIRRDFWLRIDWAIQRAKTRGLAIIIDLHHFDEIMGAQEYQKGRFLGMWRQIAERYKNQPESVIFELYNEPHGEHEPYWNENLAAALAVVRESNPTRAVIVGPNGWNSASEFKNLKLPDDPNLILTFHNYVPFKFTHQGASWAGPDATNWLGTTWTGTPEQQAEVRQYLDLALEYSKATNHPVFMGEFGAFNRADMNSRAAWTKFTREEAEARGFSWGYWEFNGGFGVYDWINERWREPLLNALISPKQ